LEQLARADALMSSMQAGSGGDRVEARWQPISERKQPAMAEVEEPGVCAECVADHVRLANFPWWSFARRRAGSYRRDGLMARFGADIALADVLVPPKGARLVYRIGGAGERPASERRGCWAAEERRMAMTRELSKPPPN
jgi:hypothetical protein